jgi:DNA-binding GntR family transcriptional regulator
MEPLHTAPDLIEQVYLRLVDAIADGSLAPNARITQEEIAQRLSVSRQPVSHALQLLRRQGLVVRQGRRGLAVAPVEPDRIRDLYQVRAALDGLAARLAAERIKTGSARPQEIKQLRSRLAAGRGSADGGSTHDWIELDVAFHASIYALSGNVIIAETVAERWLYFKRGMGVALVSREWRKLVWRQHAGIAERILAGDPAGAETAAREHAENAATKLYAELVAAAGGT